MNKGNIIRSVFWGTILLICLILGITGVVYNIKINSTYKDDLTSIVKIFNSNDLIKDYRKIDNMITAELKRNKIKVTSKGVVTLEYIYYLENGKLVTTYDKDNSLANNITMILADSISVLYGQPSGSIYPLYNSEEIFDYKLSEGIEYNEKEKKVSLSLTNPIINYNYDENPEENPKTENDINEDTDTNQNDNLTN